MALPRGVTKEKQRALNTDRIFCDSELKLNAYEALEGVQVSQPVNQSVADWEDSSA